LIAGTILLAWCLAKRLRPTWAQVRASIVIGAFFFLIGHGTLHWAEQKVPSGLRLCSLPASPSGFSCSPLSPPAVARECDASGWNSSGIRRRRPLDGPKRPEFRPGRVRRLARRPARCVFLVRGDRLLQAVASLRASTSLVGTFIAGRFRATATRRNGCGGIPRIFRSRPSPCVRGSRSAISSSSARSWPSPPTTGSSSTILPPRCHYTYVNPIVAVLLGWFFAGEAVTLNVLLSTAMVIGAVMLVDRGMARLQRGS